MHLDAAGQHRLDEHPLQPRPEVGRQRPVALGHFLRGAQIEPDAPGVGPVHQPLGLGLEHDAAAELRGGRGGFLLAGRRDGGHQRDAVAGQQLGCAGFGQPAAGRRAGQETGDQGARVGRAQPAQLGDRAALPPAPGPVADRVAERAGRAIRVGVTGHSGDGRRRHVDDCRRPDRAAAGSAAGGSPAGPVSGCEPAAAVRRAGA